MADKKWDRTLLAEEIESRSNEKLGEPLLSPFCGESLKAASYDIRAGGTVIKSLPPQEQRGGKKYQYIDLKHQGSVEIEPEESYTFYSRERVHIPTDLQGLLFNRHHWVTKRLNFDGGVVEPTYKGPLFLTFTNVGDSPVVIKYEEALVSAVFIELDRPTPRPPLPPRDRLDENRLPPPPAGVRLNAIELGRRIQALEQKLVELEPKVKLVETVHELVVFAILAGIILAAVNKLLETNVFNVSFPLGVRVWYLLAAGALLFIAWLTRRISRGKRKRSYSG